MTRAAAGKIILRQRGHIAPPRHNLPSGGFAAAKPKKRRDSHGALCGSRKPAAAGRNTHQHIQERGAAHHVRRVADRRGRAHRARARADGCEDALRAARVLRMQREKRRRRAGSKRGRAAKSAG